MTHCGVSLFRAVCPGKFLMISAVRTRMRKRRRILMGIVSRFRSQQERREESFRRPAGPDSDRKLEDIAEQDPYGMKEKSVRTEEES
jgi:hypothetical protein